MKINSWPLFLARVAWMFQGMPAVFGVLDKVVSWMREVWRSDLCHPPEIRGREKEEAKEGGLLQSWERDLGTGLGGEEG